MQIAKQKSFNIFLAFTLILSLLVSNLAILQTANADDRTTGSLTITKYKQDSVKEKLDGDGTEQTVSGETVEGVTYEVIQVKELTFDENGKEVWKDLATPVKHTKKTDANGQIKLDNLPLGKYTVQETDGPADIIINDEKFTVDIPMTNKEGTGLNYDVFIYPKNEKVQGDAELIKKGENGEALQGVVFGLYKEDGKKLEELTTDETGKISVDNLGQGKYYFQEISTVEDYALNTTKIHFEVTQKDGSSVVEWTNSAINDGNTVTNYKKPDVEKDVEGKEHHNVDRDKVYVYNLKIKTPEDIENYKALGVTDTLDDRLTYAGNWSVTGTEKSNVDFKVKGQTLIWEIDPKNLEPGAEVVITFEAKIKPDAVLGEDEEGIENTADLHFNNGKGSYTKPVDPDNPDPYDPYDPEDPDTPDPENPPTPEEPPTTPPVTVKPTEGGLKVIKVDKSDHNITLEGAEFKLTTDKEGNNVVDATGTIITVNGEVHEGLLENLVTGENGEILIEGLTPGTYYLHETKAPTYTDEDGNEKSYRLLTKPIEIEVENNKDKNKDVVVENSKSAWELPTTGGIGTVLFTVVGLVLMGIALFAYLRRKETAEQ